MHIERIPLKVKRSYLEKAATVALLVGLALLLVLTILFLLNTTSLRASAPLDTSIWSDYGTLLSGTAGIIFTIAGVVFLFVNLREQRISGAQQQIESRFFQLLQIHRDNVASLRFQYEGSEAFVAMQKDFVDIYEEVVKKFQLGSYHEHIPNRVEMNIAYLIFYFGVDYIEVENKKYFLSKFICDAIGDESVIGKIDEVIDSMRTGNEEAGLSNALFERINKLDFTNVVPLRAMGHQSRLGHYYRHLFQIIRYIDEQPSELLPYKEKYNYIKTLRAQLTTHEQALFYYNSLSKLGKSWELGQTDKNKKLITKYNIIKNIPSSFVTGLNPEALEAYPNVFYEYQTVEPVGRAELIKIYEKSDN